MESKAKLDAKHKNRYEKIMQKTYEVFTKTLPSLGFEERLGQQDMAYDITEALRDRQHIVIEAGVGIGKSFAYLIPLLLYNKDYNEPILIATSSIALQEQLINDINNVSNILGLNPEVHLAKGMRNYSCISKCLKLENNCISINENLKTVIELTKSGTIDKAKFLEVSPTEWKQVSAEDCNSKNCKYRNNCVFIRDRERLKSSQGIIVTNQDMLTKNLMNRSEYKNEMFNKEINCIIIDEGHNLEEKVRNAYTSKWTYRSIKNDILSARDSMRYNKSNVSDQIEILYDILDKLYTKLNRQVFTALETEVAEEGGRLHVDLTDIKEELRLLISKLDNYLIFVIANLDDRYDYNDDGVDNLYKLLNLFRDIQKKDSNSVYWLTSDGKGKKGISIESCSKEVNRTIHKLYFSNPKVNTVITSATLTHQKCQKDDESYSYFINNTGFPTDERGFFSTPKDSPFPYDKHSILYVSDKLPFYEDNKDGFINGAIQEIINLSKITDGKTLILFTSKKDMTAVYDKMTKLNLPWKLIKQDDGSSQSETLEVFKMDVNSILLGTGSFWEGINIEGEALSCVIIFRLPFPVPDPIIQYKCSVANNKLYDVLLPHMIIKLKQGIGRLIRNNTDKGIVAILDPRIGETSGRKYRNIVLKSLPIKNVLHNLDEVKKKYDDFYSLN